LSNINDLGLTELGFRRPSYHEILDGFEHQAKEKFTTDGKTPDLTVRSPMGMFLRIWAWIVNLSFQLLEDVYNSQFVDTAVGASLYQLGRNIGLKLLPSQRASGYEQFIGKAGVHVPAGYLVGTVSGIQFVVMIAGEIQSGGPDEPDSVILPIQCTEMGAIGNVAENTITQIINPLEGIESATNPKATDGGRSVETDEEYRDRYYKSVDFAGGVNADAIQAAILKQGVLAARVYENDKDFEDHRGLPGHSVESVVYAGLDFEVAKVIYATKGAGIQTHGSSMVEVISPQNGQTYEIRFTRPTGIPVWIKVENVKVDPDSFPTNGAERIQQALINFIRSNITGGLNIGEDVIYNQLPCRVLSVPGVIDFDMTISRNGSSYGRDNIQIGEREKAIIEADKVLVTFPAEGGGSP